MYSVKWAAEENGMMSISVPGYRTRCRRDAGYIPPEFAARLDGWAPADIRSLTNILFPVGGQWTTGQRIR